MRRTLIFLIKLAIVVAAAIWLVDRPGHIGIDWQGYAVEVPIGVGVLVILALMVLSAYAYRIWRGVRHAPGTFMRGRTRSRREKGYQALTSGMVAVAAGDADSAKRYAGRADSLLHDPPLTMLLSAQAAQLSGDEGAAQRYFESMLERPETEFLGVRGLLTQALRDGDRVKALRLAQRARALRPDTPWLLRTCFELEVRMRRWAEAVATLEQLKKQDIMPRQDARRCRAAILIERSREAEADGDMVAAMKLAHDANGALPGFLPAVLREGRLLIREGVKKKAAKMLERAWIREPHPELAVAYRELEGGPEEDPVARVKRFERLQKLALDHPEGFLALGEAELEAQLWGAARTRLERVIDEAPGRRVYRLMAELETGENSDPEAARAWMRKADEAAAEPAWVCDVWRHHHPGLDGPVRELRQLLLRQLALAVAGRAPACGRRDAGASGRRRAVACVYVASRPLRFRPGV